MTQSDVEKLSILPKQLNKYLQSEFLTSEFIFHALTASQAAYTCSESPRKVYGNRPRRESNSKRNRRSSDVSRSGANSGSSSAVVVDVSASTTRASKRRATRRRATRRAKTSATFAFRRRATESVSSPLGRPIRHARATRSSRRRTRTSQSSISMDRASQSSSSSIKTR